MNRYEAQVVSKLPKKRSTPKKIRQFAERRTQIRHGNFLRICGYLILTVLGLLTAGPAWSEEPSPPAKEAPWHIMADSIIYDSETGVYTAADNVVITKDKKKLVSDFLKYNAKTGQSQARGNVKFTSEEGYLSADTLDMNLETEQGTIENGTLFIESSHMYIRGNRLKKISKDSYTADKITVSTCDGENPDWKISGRNLKVTIEGYGTVNHATFWAKKIPVLYSPFFLFPVKLKRQTGLLPPLISFSDRKGTEIEVPLFWAINDHSDATFYANSMWKRGVKYGVEYRYASDRDSSGTLMYDYLMDDQVDDGTEENSKFGYSDDSLDRTNEKRYWLRMKHDRSLPLGVNAKLDVDVVSDQDYLREFSDGYTGFEKTDRYFTKNFGRGIDDDDITTRKNSLLLTKNWASFNLNSEFLWYDNVVARSNDTEDTTLQQLPKIEFNGTRQAIKSTPLYFDLDSDATYFYRQDTDENNPTGYRTDIYPRLYLPLRLGNYLSLEPSAGYRKTFWQIENDNTTPDEKKGNHNRGIHDIKVDASTDIYRISNFGYGGIDKIKHLVKPQVIYEFIPNQNQDDLPNFDSTDRIAEKKLVTYSLTNTFTSRKRATTPQKEGTPQTATPTYIYREFCRFKLEQSYDINEAEEDDPTRWENGLTRQPFSPIKGELEIDPVSGVSFEADFTWTRYEKEFLTRNASINLANQRGDRFKLEHRYTRDPLESIHQSLGMDTSSTTYDSTESLKGNIFFNLTDRLALYWEHERDIHEGENIESKTGFIYRSQCWSLDLSYTSKDEEEKYAFLLTLTGLGGFGSGFSEESLKGALR